MATTAQEASREKCPDPETEPRGTDDGPATGAGGEPPDGDEETTQTRGLPLPRPTAGVEPGATPGIELDELALMRSGQGEARITCIDYSPTEHRYQKVEDIESFLIHHRPPWASVRWINVDGITDAAVIYGLAEKYGLHPLAIEDVMRVPQRPKAEDYGAEGQPKRLYVIVRMIELVADHVQSEQISIFLGRNTVLTFQESPGDVWDAIRKRLATPGSRLRNGEASFLVYSLLDAIVDQCFPILERYGDRLEELEDQILNSPSGQTMAAVHEIKREILLLRRAVWPMRDVVQTLLREPHENFSEQTRTYMRDVYDHVVHVIDIIETYREVGTALTETYMSSMSNKLNQVMKVLTIITTIFVPLTFLAGVYGMNFTYLPEKDWKMGYPMFWLVSVSLAGGMLYLFRRRGWL